MTATGISAARAHPAPGPGARLKRWLPRTLFGRSLMIMLIPLILGQTIATWVFYDRHWESMTRRLTSALVGEITFVLEQLDRDETQAERFRTLLMADRQLGIAVIPRPGATLPQTERTPRGITPYNLAAALERSFGDAYAIDMRPGEDRIEILVGTETGVVQFLVSERRLYNPTTYIFIMWMVGTSTALFAIAIVFMRNQIRPIRRLAHAADSFGKGRAVADFRLEGAAEVRQAASAFLVMRERIRRQIAQRTEMLAGVSHDLRTPLTRMRLQLAMMGDGPDVAALSQDVAEMETMIQGYLAFARGEGTETAEPTDLARLMREVAKGAEREGTEVELAADDPIVIPLKPQAIKRCLTNIVGNALRHGTRVRMAAAPRDDMVEIVVDDDGPGIPPEARKDVFKPFFRLDSARSSRAGGVGLGLTIARDIVRGHGGDIQLGDSPQGGLRVTLRLPL